jgi:uncharacterized membrane protein
MSEHARPSRPRPRLETLSDLIFGLSLSIAAIALIAQAPTSTTEINNHIFAYIFTFLILITTWLAYTNIMSVLPIETRTLTVLNVTMLLLVTLSPFLLNTVEIANQSLSSTDAASIEDYASRLFALNLAGLLTIIGLFYHVLSMEEKGLVSQDLAVRFRRARNLMFVLAGVFVITIAPQFGGWMILGYPVRFILWYIPIISFWTRFLLRKI